MVSQPKHLHHFVIQGCSSRVPEDIEGRPLDGVPDHCNVPVGGFSGWAPGATIWGVPTNAGVAIGKGFGVSRFCCCCGPGLPMVPRYMPMRLQFASNNHSSLSHTISYARSKPFPSMFTTRMAMPTILKGGKPSLRTASGFTTLQIFVPTQSLQAPLSMSASVPRKCTLNQTRSEPS